MTQRPEGGESPPIGPIYPLVRNRFPYWTVRSRFELRSPWGEPSQPQLDPTSAVGALTLRQPSR